MERVVTINLNGNPYQLEEPAYDALRAYMDRARAALSANPDQAEIVRDLEQAIADKCNGYLSPGKTVVSATEMARILDEMGPVDGASDSEQPASSGAAPNESSWRPDRRLYRIYERGAWTGVSAGLAAYTGIDVAWIRALWIITALFSGGFTAIIYIVLIFAMPVAASSEEMAAAHGAPFNAQEVIDRAKREYSRFTDENAPRWRAEMRRQRRAWNEQMRQRNMSWASWDHGAGPAAAPAQPVGYATRVFAGILAFIFSIVTAVLLIGFLIALFSLLGTGALFGWTPPDDVPAWLVIVILCIAYAAISAPFTALRRTSYAIVSGHRQNSADSSGLVSIVVLGVFAWVAWMYWPEAREMMEAAYIVIRDFANYWNQQWNWN